MKSKLTISLLLLAWLPFSLPGQDLSGRWEGRITQEGMEDFFVYRIDLRQSGDLVSGYSYSATADGSAEAYFSFTGAWDGQKLVLQEVAQTEPAEPKWCLKYAVLEWRQTGSGYRLEGDWRAEGCIPGRMILEKSVRFTTDTIEQELPFSMIGTWTGQLSQSDRDYGFFFELTLQNAPAGSSFIVSEDNGGSARHALKWSYDDGSQTLVFKESGVAEKTDPRWPWCIKRGTLKMRREGGRYILEGNWQGYLEGNDPGDPRAQCAPGQVYLEKPVLTRQIVERTEVQKEAYALSNGREVKVERVLEVKSRELRIRVWDNGTVDGDVCTIFLNGERILHNFRVTKRKEAFPVTLEETNNFLILHAEDLGDISPNTVAVSVDDGVTEQIIILSSNLHESGAVLIREFKVD